MGNVEIPNWLKTLPLAPVYRPTDTEFADPIAYISKIEKEASAFGICKIIPPLPKPSKKYVFHNLNKSLLRCPELASGVDVSKLCKEDRAVFTTRHQELGQITRKKTKGGESNSQKSGVKQVWQSGGVYTLEQFEAKSKAFYKSQLGTVKEVSPVVIEALFWKAALEKPIYIEYANDVPGSAFGEPEGHFRHFRQRKRRGRGSYQRNVGNKSEQVLPEVARASLASPSCLLREDSSEKKEMDFVDEMEGSSGWKLSNCSWNLQTIARSPGSVTRFMPDDIPGVTSPMVYIGMLFSWFAWHVEDHELHSMNYLHTGSPKTWYAVPADYALEFEEVIREDSYGRNIDQLAALTQLGEKTTLASPEMIVASGIPCCRLVQNPGEFVVTFPRAYHVGFSHGFNCGEAANFGTPQWLNIAKEAAVRRAAMDYLPMLSHQQLLYLLTMSFVSRVPRSLLPGGRSSRMRDRQREEREFLVKKAFVEDILNENKNLSVLLQEPGFRLVMWDPELLPRHSALALAAAGTATGSSSEMAKTEPEEDKEKTNLLEELSLFMEKLKDVYYDDDDGLLNDFQVDTGSLACVACGILGFPFMSVVQPSEKALKDLSDRQGELSNRPSINSTDVQETATPSSEKSDCEWNTSSRYIRPRIFCLEHTIELHRLMQSRGGLKCLLICHKDFQKFKAHASVVAEEVKVSFSYDEVLLESASKEETSLIDFAIEMEENNEHGVDWTSELGINLRYCVKERKNSPTMKIQHALSLGGLFGDTSRMLEFSTIKWLQRKSRSSAKPTSTSGFTPREVERVGRKEENIIQYSRKRKSNRKSKSEVNGLSSDGFVRDVDDAVELSVQEFEETRSTVTNIEEEQKSQMVQPTKTAALSDHAQVEGEESMFSEDHIIHSEQRQESISAIENIVAEVIHDEDNPGSSTGFIISPCERLRSRGRRKATINLAETSDEDKRPTAKKLKKTTTKVHHKEATNHDCCYIEGCNMSFESKADLQAHKRNRCTYEGCGKKFRVHKYLVLHQRVHNDDRPYECTWKGCSMTFKWQWARTEHLRVHTGEKPYNCKVDGCGLSFRFVSDYSRHRRKTGHYVT